MFKEEFETDFYSDSFLVECLKVKCNGTNVLLFVCTMNYILK